MEKVVLPRADDAAGRDDAVEQFAVEEAGGVVEQLNDARGVGVLGHGGAVGVDPEPDLGAVFGVDEHEGVQAAVEGAAVVDAAVVGLRAKGGTAMELRLADEKWGGAGTEASGGEGGGVNGDDGRRTTDGNGRRRGWLRHIGDGGRRDAGATGRLRHSGDGGVDLGVREEGGQG